MTTKPVILHVEDEANDVMLVGLAFKKAACAPIIQVVRDGEQAIEYLSGVGRYADRQLYPLPTLMLLDIKLPRLSGLELLSWLRGRDDLRRLPAVMLTSSPQMRDVNKAYELGANSYLVKPSALEELVEMVAKLSAYWLDTNLSPRLVDDDNIA
jgi:CheY-like chemotaxis protein